jgi:hypothetical protein
MNPTNPAHAKEAIQVCRGTVSVSQGLARLAGHFIQCISNPRVAYQRSSSPKALTCRAIINPLHQFKRPDPKPVRV